MDMVLPIGSIADIVGYQGDLNLVSIAEMPPETFTPDFFLNNLAGMKPWHFHLMAGSPDPESGNRLKVVSVADIVNSMKTAFDYVLVDLGRSLSRISLPLIEGADLITLIISTDLSTVCTKSCASMAGCSNSDCTISTGDDNVAVKGAAARGWEITQRELGDYIKRTAGSMKATERARKVMPMGVPSSFQAYDPHPIVVRKAHSSWMEDVDGNRYIDFDMGFGALFSGHCNPIVRRAVDRQLDRVRQCERSPARFPPCNRLSSHQSRHS